MRLLFFVTAFCGAFFGTIAEGWAGAFSSSIFNTSNLRLQYHDGTIWVDASSSQATVFNTVITSESTATLGSTTVVSGIVSGSNAPQAFVSSTLFPPDEQMTIPLVSLGASSTDSYSIGDVYGIGSSLIGNGVSTAALAEVNALGTTGFASGNVGGESIFQLNIHQTGQYRLAFNVALEMQAVGRSSFATSEFRVRISQGGNTFNDAIGDLNRNIDGSFSGQYYVYDYRSFVTGPANLMAGSVASFAVTQNTTAGVVPEPSSLAVFGLMSIGSVVAWRRRRASDLKPTEA